MNRPNWIGQILGARYRIDEIVGQGGMSAVYKAYDPNLRRLVAVKMIHSHLADDPMFLMRFEEEATAVAQLRHPNIVQVYDFNHDEDLYYMVQEFVPGETLQERLRRLNHRPAITQPMRCATHQHLCRHRVCPPARHGSPRHQAG
jgi:serine/threonine-protein kinase